MANLSERALVAYGLKDIFFGEYGYSSSTGKITYANQNVLGRGITATFELKFAEGRLYSSGVLSRFKKIVTGGSISLNVEALTLAVQKSLFAATETSTTVGSGTVTGIGYSSSTTGRYVGVATYVPADEASGDKYICVFVRKAMFGPPSMSYQTAGESITWNTPTTTGEFLAPDKLTGEADVPMLEIAEADTEADAIAWCKAQLGWSS